MINEVEDEELEKILQEEEDVQSKTQENTKESKEAVKEVDNESSNIVESEDQNHQGEIDSATNKEQENLNKEQEESNSPAYPVTYKWDSEDKPQSALYQEIVKQIITATAPKKSTTPKPAPPPKPKMTEQRLEDINIETQVVETRISFLISNLLNQFGRVMTIPSLEELHTRKEKVVGQSPSFEKLRPSLQRKMVLLECTLEHLTAGFQGAVNEQARIVKAKKAAKEKYDKDISKRKEAHAKLKQKYATLLARAKKMQHVSRQYKEMLLKSDPEALSNTEGLDTDVVVEPKDEDVHHASGEGVMANLKAWTEGTSWSSLWRKQQ